jgi:hypothetical protein
MVYALGSALEHTQSRPAATDTPRRQTTTLRVQRAGGGSQPIRHAMVEIQLRSGMTPG